MAEALFQLFLITHSVVCPMLQSQHKTMKLLYILIAGHVLSALVLAAPTDEDAFNQDTPYIKELLRQAKVAEIESFMDQKADPCTDFYAFSCGNYKRINSALNLQQGISGLLDTLRNGLNRKILKMLNKATDTHDTPEDIQVKHFFKSCLRIKKLNYKEKLKQIIGEFGTMPVLEGSSWQEDDFDWVETTARIGHRYGIASIIRVEVGTDVVNSQRNSIFVGEQNFPLETRSMYVDNDMALYRQTHLDRIELILQRLLGVEMELAIKTAKEVFDFEVDLANGLEDKEEPEDPKDQIELLTVAELRERYASTFDAEQFIFVSLGEEISEPIYEVNRRYQRNLVEVIRRTPKRTVANYIFYRLIWEFILKLTKSSETMQEPCAYYTKKYFAKNLDNMFYRRYQNEQSSREIENMWHQMKSNFREALLSSPELDWMERSTRNIAIAKLDSMTLEVNSYSKHNFTEDFADLNLQGADYVENLGQVLQLRAKQMRQLLHQPAKPAEPAVMLSFSPSNDLLQNAIKLPVAMLQPYYLWSEVYPNAVMFGSLASLIGHELIHGFEGRGRQVDDKGNIRDWWDEKSSSNFLQRNECFAKQYGRYVYNGIQLKETTEQSENIADNGGTRLAYAAYRKWFESQVTNGTSVSQLLAKESLPKLPYSANQLFFISFAQIWCNDVHPLAKSMLVSVDEHTPGKFRVIGTLSNFKEFSKEFNCPAGSAMNPCEKCMIY
ncbi:neprilysin-4-like [Drosophila santomea]|uniref:neprilysin-4-like n=1 Tax=Drosophila santomea TaxID=129105 RepID=UPI001953A54C|nr:neprilysin-4-like [Drosophila santomea]